IERGRERSGQPTLRILQFRRRYFLFINPLDLVEKLLERTFSHFSPHISTGGDHSGILKSAEVAGRAVSVALALAQIQKQTRRRITAEDMVHHEERKIVRISALN